MSKGGYDIAATYHSLPEPLAGWYWTCGCAKCRACAEWHYHGPFKSRRQARANGVPTRNSNKVAAPLLITKRVRRVRDAPGGGIYDMHLKKIRASTREWVDRAQLAMSPSDGAQH
jgi:hypothetical protein